MSIAEQPIYVNGLIEGNCPRRVLDFPPRETPGTDSWDTEDNTCGYCGSLHPDTFMARIEAGDVELGPTDKNYKVYVHNAGGAQFKQHYRNCYAAGANDCKYATCTHWVTREMSECQFYFQHLSVEQRRRFVELLNDRKLKIGYPGHFYRLPFFCVKLK